LAWNNHKKYKTNNKKNTKKSKRQKIKKQLMVEIRPIIEYQGKNWVWEISAHNWWLIWRRNWRNGLNWFNLAKIEKNWKFKDEFETNSQFRKLIKGLIEKKY